MKVLLTATIIASFLFALVSFMLSKQKKWAMAGLLICTLAIVIGGLQVEGRPVEKNSWHLSVDWLLLDLLLMAAIFVPIEMVFPKNRQQSKFHEEWRTDLLYFVISHLFIQFFGVITQKPAKLHIPTCGVSIPYTIPPKTWIGWPDQGPLV
jgi:lathosterol oxidase